MSLETQLHDAADKEFDPLYRGLFEKFENDFATLIGGYCETVGPIQTVTTFVNLRYTGSNRTGAKELYEFTRDKYREQFIAKFIAKFIEKAREAADIVDSLPQQ